MTLISINDLLKNHITIDSESPIDNITSKLILVQDKQNTFKRKKSTRALEHYMQMIMHLVEDRV